MKPVGLNLSAPSIARPIATTLLALAVLLSGLAAFTQLPVSPLPQVDFPTIVVNASLPGASPETMAATIATPLGAFDSSCPSCAAAARALAAARA